MIIVITCLIAVAVLAFILSVRPGDLPAPEPESPFRHFDERKAAIYENLRDLQFEFRLGKLSEADYQSTKKDLQKELANVLAEVDKLRATLNGAGEVAQAPRPPAKAAPPAKPAAAAAAARKDGSHAAAKAPAAEPPATPPEAHAFVCDSCGAQFEVALKFCGECGKPMKVAR